MGLLLLGNGIVDEEGFERYPWVFKVLEKAGLPMGWGVTFGEFLYIFARAITLALAFTTLRSLPSAAYETVQWTTFIPHV